MFECILKWLHRLVIFQICLAALALKVFVEALDKCFENVCELDIIFHSDKVYATVIYKTSDMCDLGSCTGELCA